MYAINKVIALNVDVKNSQLASHVIESRGWCTYWAPAGLDTVLGTHKRTSVELNAMGFRFKCQDSVHVGGGSKFLSDMVGGCFAIT